jgi:hypothetical protein
MFGLFSRFIGKKATATYDSMLKSQIDIMEEVSSDVVFWNAQAKVFMRPTQLNSYHYLAIVVVGNFNINTVEGLKITFFAEEENYAINSESSQIKSEYSENLGSGLTTFDLDLDQNFIDFIQSKHISSVRFETKNGQFRKENFSVDFNEINQENMKKAVNFSKDEEE